MPRAVANTLLPAARPASTIARPRPRELPVTNHTCAIHPPVYRSQPLGYSIEASQTQDWMHDGYSQRMLSQRLRLLEKCELVKQTVHLNFHQRWNMNSPSLGKRSVRRS